MTKPPVTVFPLHHRGAKRIKVECPFDEVVISMIKKIEGRQWSKTHQCWHVPYTPEVFQQLKEMFEVKISQEFSNKKGIEKPTKPSEQKTGEVICLKREAERRIKAYVPWKRKDWIEKIKTIPGRAWNENEKYWSLPLSESVITALDSWFGRQLNIEFRVPDNLPAQYLPKNWKTTALPAERQTNPKSIIKPVPKTPIPKKDTAQRTHPVIPSLRDVTIKGQQRKAVTGDTIIVQPGEEGWLKVYVPYNHQNWIDHVKRIPGRAYSHDETCWKVPYNQESVRELQDYFKEQLVLTFHPPGNLPEKWTSANKFPAPIKAVNKLNDMQRLAITALEEKLILESKLHRTIKTYKNQLTGLLAHYPDVKPSQISTKQIQSYIIYRRKEGKLGNSAINSLISALNAFFGRALKQTEKVQALERPPKTRTLPNVLSTEEVQRLLSVTDNIKHKCMLPLIYSAGLRKGELLKLHVRDLNAARQCLFVKNGKGGKGRFSFYTPAAIKYVIEYIRKYKPRYWLFEGRTGEQYSETSLQIIFDAARKTSGVNPNITIHGLRHSFATHIVEKNVPLHVVKQLLGHQDIKTTEVYLHISNKYMMEIKSPLEGMDV
jgi:integrase/recombinase XerD